MVKKILVATAAVLALTGAAYPKGTLQSEVRDYVPPTAKARVPQASMAVKFFNTHTRDYAMADFLAQEARAALGKSASLDEYAGWVNRKVNEITEYRSDSSGTDDWRTPVQSSTGKVGQLYGDCEEFALLKLAVLSKLGLDSGRIGLASFGRANGDLTHITAVAILANGDIVYLSNDISTPVSGTELNQVFGGKYAFSIPTFVNGDEMVCDPLVECQKL